VRPLPLALVLLLTTPLLGCLNAPTVKAYEGKTQGYTPTNAFLKVNVRHADGTYTMFDFDRRDWYTAEVARRVDAKEIPDLTIQGQARETLGEILVLDVLDPSTVSVLRYDKMQTTPESRAQMDDEYDAVLHPMREPPITTAPTLPLDLTK
jgi:hypothetical protein